MAVPVRIDLAREIFLAAAKLPENAANDVGGITFPFILRYAAETLAAIELEINGDDFPEG